MSDADKQRLQHELVSRLMSIPSVLSVTLVGSLSIVKTFLESVILIPLSLPKIE